MAVLERVKFRKFIHYYTGQGVADLKSFYPWLPHLYFHLVFFFSYTVVNIYTVQDKQVYNVHCTIMFVLAVLLIGDKLINLFTLNLLSLKMKFNLMQSGYFGLAMT